MLETSLCILNDLKEQLDLATSKCCLILQEIDSIKESVEKSSDKRTILVENDSEEATLEMDCTVVEKGFEISGEKYVQAQKVDLTLKNTGRTRSQSKCTRFLPKKTKKKTIKSTRSVPKNEVIHFMKRYVDRKEKTPEKPEGNFVSKLIEKFNQEADTKQNVKNNFKNPILTKKAETTTGNAEKSFMKRQMTFNTIPFIVGLSTSKSYNIGLSTQESLSSIRVASYKFQESSSVFEIVADFWAKRRPEISTVPRCECLPPKFVKVDQVWNEILNFKNNVSTMRNKPNNSFFYTKLFRRIQRLQEKYERNKTIDY